MKKGPLGEEMHKKMKYGKYRGFEFNIFFNIDNQVCLCTEEFRGGLAVAAARWDPDVDKKLTI